MVHEVRSELKCLKIKVTKVVRNKRQEARGKRRSELKFEVTKVIRSKKLVTCNPQLVQ